MKPHLLTLALCFSSACFSTEDFGDCSEDLQCGQARVCFEGRCVFTDVATDTGPPDDSPEPDAAAPVSETVVLSGSLSGLHDHLGKRVQIGDVTVEEGRFLTVLADVIEVTGPVRADGAGDPGGDGGGGGAAGHSVAGFFGGQSGGPAAQDGQPNMSEVGGRGGEGASGGGQRGGAPGEGGAAPGEPGAAGTDAQIAALSCANTAEIRWGSGGGGGGGGAGAQADGCTSRGGGGGGGAGGPGGGAIILEAETRIELAAPVSARGLPADTDPAPDAAGGAPCGGDPCEAGCVSPAGNGGDGAAAGDSPSGPGASPGDGGEGGVGGAGSGGMVRLKAPRIVVSGQGAIDVSGGAENGGRVLLLGAVEGPLDPVGVAEGQLCTDEAR